MAETLTTEQVLAILRRIIDEVDELTSDFTNDELLAVIGDERDLLILSGLQDFSGLTVVAEEGAPGYGITPDPTLQQGHILALRAATEVLTQIYRAKVKRGELGGSWTSGLEHESTINTQKAYKDAITELATKVQALELVMRAPRTGQRPQ
jgi:hypothetical protein